MNGLKTVECTRERRRVWYMNGEPGKLLFLKQGEETEQVWAELLPWEPQRTEAISLWVQAEAGTACKICLLFEVTAQTQRTTRDERCRHSRVTEGTLTVDRLPGDGAGSHLCPGARRPIQRPEEPSLPSPKLSLRPQPPASLPATLVNAQ